MAIRPVGFLRLAALLTFALALGAGLAPIDLVRIRGQMLGGLVGQYCPTNGSLEVHGTGYFGDEPALDLTAETNSTPVTAMLRDQYGGPVPGEIVTFSTDIGSFTNSAGDPATTERTDSNDNATLILTIGHFDDDVTVNVTATACTLVAPRALRFRADVWPGNSAVMRYSAGVAERQGARTSPLFITVLQPRNPQAAADEEVNYPQIANLSLKIKVGKFIGNAFVEDNSLGSVTPTQGKTDANGQIKAEFRAKPGNTAEGSLVVVAWLDRLNRLHVRNGIQDSGAFFFVYTQSNTDLSSLSAPKYYNDCHIRYKSSIEHPGISNAFAGAIADWDAVTDGNNVDHFKFVPEQNPQASNPKGFEAFANCPPMPGQWRDAFAVTQPLVNRDDYYTMTFYLESLYPDPVFHVPVTGNENICRSFFWTPPAAFVKMTAFHEIGHILGIDHHGKVDGQKSIMCLWRGQQPAMGQGSATFPFYVNDVLVPSGQDKAYINTISYPAPCP